MKQNPLEGFFILLNLERKRSMRRTGERFIVVLCMLFMILAVIPAEPGYAAASGYPIVGDCGTDMTYVLSSDGELNITGGGDMDNFSSNTVPWRQYRTLITRVTFEGNVTSIGSYAFNYCTKLKSITIPNSVTTIGDYAFNGCTALGSIAVSSNVKEIGDHAFQGCGSLSRATIARGVTRIGAYAFSDCTNLTEISLPTSVTEIGDYAFSGCTKLSAVTLNRGLTEIGAGAFSGCKSLMSLAIPETVTSIGEQAFEGTGIDDSEIAYKRGSCGTNLTWELYGGNRILISGTGDMTDFSAGQAPWYSYLLDITEVTIEDGVTGIGDFAWKDFTELTSVTLADSLKRIGKNAFEGCTKLTEIALGEQIAKISEYAFHQSGLKEVLLSGSGEVSIGSYAYADCKSLERMELRTGTFSIGDHAFSGCGGLKQAAVSAAVANMGSHMFADCTVLAEVSLGTGSSKIGNYMFAGCKALKSVELLGRTEEVGEHAFENCTGLEQIALPETVTELGAGVFSGCSSLQEVQFSQKLETIGADAFAGCTNITAMVLPDSVNSVGSGIFSGCSALERITLPFAGEKKEPEAASEKTLFGYIFGTKEYEGGVKVTQSYTDKDSAVYYLPKTLISVTVTGGKLLYGVFDQCTAIETIVLPEAASAIGNCAFRGCTGLKEITLPGQLTEIGEYAFRECSGLTGMTLPNGMVTLKTGVFYDCTALESITFPETVVKIADQTFHGCTKLNRVTLSSKTEQIGEYAFEGCTELSGIELPNTVAKIGAGAWKDCTGLLQIVLPEGAAEISEETFLGCTALERAVIPVNVTVIGSSAFSGCALLEDVSVPETVTEIGEYAFRGCKLLSQLELPQAVKTIGSGAFSGCSGLKKITLPFTGGSAEAEQAAAGTLFGYIFGTEKYTDGMAVKQYFSNAGTATYYIPESLTEVTVTGGRLFYGTFYGCTNLKSIRLSSSERMTEIGASAFYNCTGLEEFVLPEGVTAIGSKAFGKCQGLTEFTVIPGVVKLGESAFDGCTELTEISLPEGLAEIGAEAFKNCGGLMGMVVPKTVKTIGKGAFSGCAGLTGITLPFVGGGLELTTASEKTLFGYIFGTEKYTDGKEVVQYVGSASFTNYIPAGLKQVVVTGGSLLQGAFYNCKGFSRIVLPESLKEIGNHAFYGCSGLTGITLPAGLTRIGNYAFYNCTGLERMQLPSEVTIIGSYAFTNCTALSQVALSAKTAVIGSCAFANCTGLARFTIPASVEKIESEAFSGCSALEQVTIAEGVREIGNSAFSNCAGLTTVVIPNSVTSMGSAVFSGCSGISDLTLPFVGKSASLKVAAAESLFGYIFGSGSYTGAVATRQYYSNSSSTYYLPGGLRRVVVNGGNLLYGAFSNCNRLTEIQLPDSLEKIGDYAFRGCSALTGMNLPSGLLSIGNNAFMECKGLKTLSIPSGVTSIGNYAFQACTSLASFAFPAKVTAVSDYIFDGCSSLAHVTIPDGVETIGTYAFKNCGSLTGIVIPDSVKMIQLAAFSGCSGLTEMTLPFVGYNVSQTASDKRLFGYIFGMLRYDGGEAAKQFYSNSSVTYYIPASLKRVVITGGYMTYGAFSNCGNLTEILLPDNLAEIKDKAFYNCKGLAGIRIPTGVTKIAAEAFSGCSNLRSIAFSGNAPSSIAENAFTGVTATVFYPTSNTSWSACAGKQYGGTLTWEAHDHEYRATVTAPTCTEQGYTTYQCRFCQSSYIDNFVEAIGHEKVIDPGKEASCISTGLTEGAHCSRCGEVITPQKIIPAAGHRFVEYVSNQDADYEKDGTKTAECSNGCGTTDTIVDIGSQLKDTKKPELELTLGTNHWNSCQDAASFALCYNRAQTVTIAASDNETLLNGSTVSRLNKVSYFISDEPLREHELKQVSWKDYTGGISLEPDGKYMVYAKAEDKSGNTAYASTEGILVDGTPPVLKGISSGEVYCGRIEFTAEDLSLQSVSDNGTALMPKEGVYTVEGSPVQHVITALDACGNETTVTVEVKQSHAWGEPEFTWSKDYKTCTARFVCGNNSSHVERADCTVKSEVLGGSCITAGDVIYTASVTLDGVERTDRVEVSGIVPGHAYKPEFTWSADHKSCTAELICTRESCLEETEGHRISGLQCTVELETTEATCVLEGKNERAAKFTHNGVEYKDVCDVEIIPVNPKKHGDTELRDEKEADCMADGYTGDTYCRDCGKRIADGAVIKRLPHTWDEGRVTKQADCIHTGVRTYTCTYGCNTVREEEISIDENYHINTVTVGMKEPTEDTPGYTGDLYCSDCKKTVVYGTVIPAAGKPPVTSPDEPGKPPVTSPDEPDNPPGGTNPGGTNPGGTNPGGPNPGGTNPGGTNPGGTNPDGSKPPAGSTGGNQPSVSPAAKGSRIKDGKGNCYTVTKADSKGAAVSFTAPKNKKVASVSIPATVKIGGVSYQVTSIAKSALAGCKKLRKVTIGGNVTSIGDKAFYQCKALTAVTIPKKVAKIGKQAFYGAKKLKKVTIKSTKLNSKRVGSKAFGNIHKQAVVKVPKNKLAAYRKMLKKRGITGKKQKIKK